MMTAVQVRTRVDEYDVDVDDVRLHVRDVGATDALPVLFLHGVMGHRRDWDVLIHDLGEDHRVIAPDQRGHGRSAWSATYSTAAMARDVVALLGALDLQDGVTVVGHSLGAMVGLVVAAERPELVDRLVLVDMAPASLQSEFARQVPQMVLEMGTSRYATVDEAVDEWQSSNPFARRELLHNYVRHALVRGPDGRYRWGFDVGGLAQLVATGMPMVELDAAADRVTAPSLLVIGEHSAVVTRDEADALARRLPHGRVEVVANGAHDLGVEQPEAVAAAVRRHVLDMPAV